MAVKNKRRSVPKDAAAFARWVEEQAATDAWLKALYQPIDTTPVRHDVTK